jgi:hypothetical protein
MKRVILAALAAIVLAAPAGLAQQLKFAVVPKAMNNPFFDIARDGCIKRAKELGNVECVYRGPIEHEPATQVQIIQDLITQRVDGLELGMTLDPAAPKGREIVERLVATADVVVANLPPAVLRSLALDLESLRRTKPDIILTTVTGFGAGGPLSHKHGFDGIGQAMSGAVYLTGTPEQPSALKVPWVDFGTACLSAFGTLAALIERGKTGRGQKV